MCVSGAGGGGIDCQKACIERRKPREGESIRGGFPYYKGGSGASPGKFLVELPECISMLFSSHFY